MIFVCKGEFEGNVESFDGYDGDGVDGWVDGKVDEGIFFVINGSDFIDYDESEYYDGECV